MLKILRKNTKAVIWIIVVSFVMWGGFAVGTQFSGPGVHAGKVFGGKISIQEFNRYYRANQIFSYSETPITDPSLLRQQTWQNIILAKEAKNASIDVSDQEVSDEIMRLLKSQKIENPTADFYERWLKATVRETPQEFEKQIRELLRVQKLVQSVNNPSIDPPTESQIRETFELTGNKLSLEMIEFQSKDEAYEFYENNASKTAWATYKEENPTKIQPTENVSLAAFISVWRIPEEEARNLHQLDIGAFPEPIEILGKHIVFHITGKENADEEAFEAELKDQIKEDILKQRRYQRFLEWSYDVNQRAQLEDYLPQEPANPAAQPPPDLPPAETATE